LSSLDPHHLTREIKAAAGMLGFDLAGVCAAVEPTGISRFRQWLAAGHDGQMRYLADRAGAYEHPQNVLDGVRSIVMLTMNYRTQPPREPQPGEGRVSRYAWGDDYHDLIHDRLKQLRTAVAGLSPDATCRGVIDTAPLLERDYAQLAGLGWIGKNTMLINRRRGSWFFLAALLTDAVLEYDLPHETDHCGTCRACLDACPTDAFPEPYVLDARRCISYLTIELREPVPSELREGVGDWLFGCDICQEVCPWNRHAPVSEEPVFQPTDVSNPVDLASLFQLDDAAFRERFRHTPLWRSKRRGILRNAAIVAGNQRSPGAVPALIGGLNDEEPLVRGASAWALGRYGDKRATEALRSRHEVETDDDVRQEIHRALSC
jgi:epoxyqueuosine reductase